MVAAINHGDLCCRGRFRLRCALWRGSEHGAAPCRGWEGQRRIRGVRVSLIDRCVLAAPGQRPTPTTKDTADKATGHRRLRVLLPRIVACQAQSGLRALHSLLRCFCWCLGCCTETRTLHDAACHITGLQCLRTETQRREDQRVGRKVDTSLGDCGAERAALVNQTVVFFLLALPVEPIELRDVRSQCGRDTHAAPAKVPTPGATT